MTAYNGNAVPAEGQAISYVDGQFVIPDAPVIPYIEGDGTGRDIWKASKRVFDAAVAKSFWRETTYCLVRGLCRREGLPPVWRVAAAGHA